MKAWETIERIKKDIGSLRLKDGKNEPNEEFFWESEIERAILNNIDRKLIKENLIRRGILEDEIKWSCNYTDNIFVSNSEFLINDMKNFFDECNLSTDDELIDFLKGCKCFSRDRMFEFDEIVNKEIENVKVQSIDDSMKM